MILFPSSWRKGLFTSSTIFVGRWAKGQQQKRIEHIDWNTSPHRNSCRWKLTKGCFIERLRPLEFWGAINHSNTLRYTISSIMERFHMHTKTFQSQLLRMFCSKRVSLRSERWNWMMGSFHQQLMGSTGGCHLLVEISNGFDFDMFWVVFRCF